LDEDEPWLLPHLPKIAPDATGTATAEQIRKALDTGRSIGPASGMNIPLPRGKAPETRESWLMGHIADMLPIVGEGRAIDAGNTLAREGHPLAGAAIAGLGVLPMGGRIAKSVEGKAASQIFDHYSNADLAEGVLDPAFMGTGKPGREKLRTDAVKMLHVYTPGARPEPEFARMPKYNVHLPADASIYDIAEDPDGIAAKVMKDVRSGRVNGNPASVLERRIQKAGHDGYTDSYNSPTIVKLYGKQPVTPDGEPLSILGDSVATNTARRVPQLGEGIVVKPRPGNKYAGTPDGQMRRELDELVAKYGRPAGDSVATNGVQDAARVLRQFQQSSGAKNLPRVTAVDAEKARHMAKIYDALPKHDPAARAAYDALNAEVEHQHQAILDAGHTINYVDHDPYKNSKEMIADIRDNKNLNVFKTSADQAHPYMTPEQNDKFRAVHDWLAHAGEGHSFGPIGEENAYRVHASTLSPLAQRALATETRGQNSWVNFGPHADLPVTKRPFAEQKAALWPEGFTGDYHEMPVPEAPAVITPPSNGNVFDTSKLGAALPAGFTADRPPVRYPTARVDLSMLGDLDSRVRKSYTPSVMKALAENPRSGGWYDTSALRDAFASESPTGVGDFEQFMRFMGPTSTGTTVPQNIRQASKFYELWKNGELDPQQLADGTLSLPPGYANRRQKTINAGIRRILETGNLDPMQQPKTYRYANQLAGSAWGGTALDMHVGRQIGKQGLLELPDGSLEQRIGFPEPSYNTTRRINTSPAGTHYPVIEDAMVKEANRVGLPPAVYQALGWVGGMNKTRSLDPHTMTDSRPVMDLVNEMLKNTATKYNYSSPLAALHGFIRGQSPLWAAVAALGLGAADDK
jgi:hypothetical protein